MRAVVEAVRTGRPSPFELEGLAAVSRLTLEMAGLAGDAAEGSE